MERKCTSVTTVLDGTSGTINRGVLICREEGVDHDDDDDDDDSDHGIGHPPQKARCLTYFSSSDLRDYGRIHVSFMNHRLSRGK